MTPSIINLLAGPNTGTFSGEEKTPSGNPGQFQSLMTKAIWQLLQRSTVGKQTETAEPTVTKADGKASGKKKSTDAVKILAAAIMASASDKSDIPPIISPAISISLPEASAQKTALKSDQIMPAILQSSAQNPVSTLVAETKSATVANQSAETVSQTKTLAEMISASETPMSIKVGPPKDAAVAKAAEKIPTASQAIEVSSAKNIFGDAQVHSPKAEIISEPTLKIHQVQATSKINGTVVAQQDVQMKKMEKASEVAGQSGSAEQVLPTKTSVVPIEKNLPVEFSVPVHASKIIRAAAEKIPASAAIKQIATATATQAIAVNSSETDKIASASADSAPAVADTNWRMVERTHNLMAMHAIQLRDSNAASLRVVIKPDTGMQLSLELRQRGDGIDARAILQQGDLNQLSQQWPELQQRLEQRGIKLAPLTGENFADGERQSFQHEQNQSAKKEFSSDEPQMNFSISEPRNNVSRTMTTSNRLESWA